MFINTLDEVVRVHRLGTKRPAAFKKEALSCRTYNRGFSEWIYDDPETSLDEVLSPGFFASVANRLRNHDAICLNLSDGVFLVYVQKHSHAYRGEGSSDYALRMVNQTDRWEDQDDAFLASVGPMSKQSHGSVMSRVVGLSYSNHRLWFSYQDGTAVGIPMERFPVLEENLDQLSRYEECDGAVHWPDLNLTISIPRVAY